MIPCMCFRIAKMMVRRSGRSRPWIANLDKEAEEKQSSICISKDSSQEVRFKLCI